MSKDDFQIKHSRTWSDDERYINQKNRKFFEDRNYWILNE
jgi:hypothetical protein